MWYIVNAGSCQISLRQDKGINMGRFTVSLGSIGATHNTELCNCCLDLCSVTFYYTVPCLVAIVASASTL